MAIAIVIIGLLSIVISIQIIFIIRVIKRANIEKQLLINLHNEHISLVEEQLTLYKELLSNSIVYDNVGNKIVNWCSYCGQPSLQLINSRVTCTICKQSPNVDTT